MSALTQPITIRAGIKYVRNRPKKKLRQIVLSAGRNDAARIGRLSLLEGIAFQVSFSAPDKNIDPIIFEGIEIEYIDTKLEVSERTVTVSYRLADALKAAELGTHEQIEFLTTFTPSGVTKRPADSRDADESL